MKVFNLLNNKVMKNYTKYICLFLAIVGMSLGQKVWSAESTVATFSSLTLVDNDTYQAYEDEDWYLSVGGGNDKAGFNWKSSIKTIGNTFGTGANASHHGWYVRSIGKMQDVCKVTFTYTFCSVVEQCENAKIYLAYSTNGSTWSAVGSLKEGSQGMGVAPSNTTGGSPAAGYNETTWTFEFPKIAEAYYAVIVSRNGTCPSDKGFNFSHTTINFIKGCCEELDKPTGLTVTQNVGGNHGKTTWSWNSVTHADSYVLSITKNETTTNTYSVASTSKTGTISAPGNYTWSVSAVGSDPYCEDNPAQDGTPFCIGADLTAVTPSGLSATPTSTSAATISWSSVSGAEYYEVEVKVDVGATVTSDIVAGTSWNATGLSPNTTYRVFWKAVNICDDSYNSAVNSSYTFTITAHTVQFDLNGKGSGKPSDQTVLHGGKATTPTPPTAPEGWSFGGWYKESGCTNAWNFGSDVVNADVTLYAKWVEKRTLTVASVSYVTISATSPSVAEGSSAYVAPGATVTLTHNTPTSPYTWCGWNVYKTEDPSTKVTVTSNSFTMPDYNVTVSAYLFGDLRAFCEPEIDITLTGDVWLTSYANLSVYTTNNPNNLITVTCTDFGSANRLGVQYLLNGTPVTYTTSPFRLCFYGLAGKSDYAKADGEGAAGGYRYLTLTDAYKTAIASGQTFAIEYNPGASRYDQEDTYTIRIAALDGSTDKGHEDIVVHGRALPQKFVIAANIGGQWKAMPADWETSSSAATTHEPYPITVNTMVNPTQATIAPKEAIYSAAARPTPTLHRGGIRLETTTGDGNDGHLQASRSNSSNKLWRTDSDCSTGMQTWYLTSSDFGDYSIGVDPSIKVSSAGTDEGDGDGAATLNRSLRVYDGKITWSNEGATTFRILPVTKEAEEVNLQVVEWKKTGVVFMYYGNPTYKASVEIEGVLKSASPAVLGTALKVDEGVYEIAVSDLDVATNAYKSMYIVIWDGETEVGRKQVTIPMMVNSTTTVDAARTAAGVSDKSNCHYMDLVVLSGGKLSTGETSDGSKFTFKSVTVYGGGKFIMPASNHFSTKAMYLRAGRVNVATKGATPSTSYVYTYPQVYIGSGATLSVTGNVINFDYLTNYDQYFGLALPYPVTIDATTDIFYPSDIYGAQAKRGSFLLRVFDSKIRANSGAVNAVWVNVEEGNTSTGCTAVQSETQRGLGYTMLGVPLKVSINNNPTKVRQKYGIHRMKMDITDASTLATNENSNATYDVTAYSAASITNSGWWLLGNPYMANLGGASVTGTSITVGSLGTNAQGQYEWQNKSVRYVTVPDDAGGDTYDQRTVDSYTFPAFKPFYVQVGKTGTVTFTPANRAAAAPKRFRNEEMPAEIATSIALNSTEYGDTTHLLIGDAFSDEYEIGDDLTKMPHANVNLFTISGANDLFANALNTQSALAGIPVGYIAPMAGSYEFTVNDKEDNSWIEHLWLTDLDLSRQTDLLVEPYEFETDAVTNKTRFMLNVVLKSPNGKDVTTGVDDVHGENERPFKFLYRDKMYILRGGKLYDATGKQVREIQ